MIVDHCRVTLAKGSAYLCQSVWQSKHTLVWQSDEWSLELQFVEVYRLINHGWQLQFDAR